MSQQQEPAGYSAAGGVDPEKLERQIAETYRDVANAAGRALHFRTGRRLAEALSYPADLLDRPPADAVNSFAGVGYFQDLAAIAVGEAAVVEGVK